MSLKHHTFDYAYDGSGRLLVAAFAQSPVSGHAYEIAADKRALAVYTYDAGGRTTKLEHLWQSGYNTGTGTYSTNHVLLKNECDYEVTTGSANYNRGLKTTSRFYSQDTGNPGLWHLDRTELFDYENSRDYLTYASYDGGSTSTTWSYDPAGNRNDASVVDNLNRATTIGGVSRTYDVLGNTLTIGSTQSMGWDELNRMTSYTSGSSTTTYQYRADGMRTKKATNATIYTAYAYDGQMPMEEFNYRFMYPGLTFIKVIRYGLGARGVDYIERLQVGGTVLTGFPLYDAHGNNVATLMRSASSPYYSLGDARSYDAWGGIRAGNTIGEPNPRHCANLGHLSDDESGFVYMRARYYEPASGRFLSEDPRRQGRNCFLYAAANPVNLVDNDGRETMILPGLLGFLTLVLGALNLVYGALVLTEAMAVYTLKLSECKDDLAAENLWGRFMKAYNRSGLFSGDISSWLAVIGGGASQAGGLLSSAGYDVMPGPGVAGTLVTGANLGMRGAFLCYGYEMRVAWYLEQL